MAKARPYNVSLYPSDIEWLKKKGAEVAEELGKSRIKPSYVVRRLIRSAKKAEERLGR